MDIQKSIFKIYIFLLPFLLLPGLANIKSMISDSATVQNDLFILLIGITIFILVKRGKIIFEKKYLYTDIISVCFKLVILSTVTSLLLFFPFGTVNGENTITASIPNNIYMIITAMAFYYNAQMFKKN